MPNATFRTIILLNSFLQEEMLTVCHQRQLGTKVKPRTAWSGADENLEAAALRSTQKTTHF